MTDALLITGGAGFIGSAFTTLAVEKGYHALILDSLTYAGSRDNLIHLPETAYTLIEGDIRNALLVNELLQTHQPASLIHFAAESHVDNSITGPGAFIDTNITGTYTLLEAARAYAATKDGFRFLHISTDEVYGSLGAEGYFDETTPYAPNSPYSASKAASDHLARAWHHTYGLKVITTHCSNNYGPRQHAEKLIPHMIRCALALKPLPIYGDGRNIRDWIHVDDHCHGLWLALQRGTPGEVYNFGGRAEMTNLALVTLLCELLDELRPRPDKTSYKALITFVTDRPGHDRRYAIDDTKAEKELGFTRHHHFTSGLRETVEWYLDNQLQLKQ